jgi:uncharacterized SAM-binding protein YcdF (DUF218 family)
LPEFPQEVFFGGGIDRLLAGITLWRDGKAPKLVLSGGTVPGEPYAPEAEAMAQFATSFAHVPDSVLLLEPHSVNTLQNARFTSALFDSLGLEKRIILVTSAFHIRRAKMFFQREGFAVHLYPTDFLSNSRREFEFPFAILPSAENLAYTTRLYREIIGYTWYRFKS